jgi:cephalosporin hydroxylase
MDLLGKGNVITIDIADRPDFEHPRISFLRGSSTDDAIVDQVRRTASAADGHVLVILDSNHARDHVARELELYGPLVTPGSYILSMDGLVDQYPIWRDKRPGPLPANRAFLEQHPEFEHDRGRNNRFGITHHPVGWLRRVG